MRMISNKQPNLTTQRIRKRRKNKVKGSKKKLYLFMEQKGGQFSGLWNQREESTEKGMGPDY